MIPNIFSRKAIIDVFRKFLDHPESAEKTSLAIAIGLFAGLAIPIGLQIPVALLLAMIFRVRKILPLICTCITNPYTVPFLYPLITYLGSIILRERLSLGYIEKALRGLVSDFSWNELWNMSWDILLPFFVGSFVVAVLSATAGYFTSYGILMKYRRQKK